MAEGQRRAASAAEIKEGFEIIDKNQIPHATELKNEEKEKTEEARWSAPLLSLAKRASENLALSYGNALKSASLVGFISKPVSNDSTARTIHLGSRRTALLSDAVNSLSRLGCGFRAGAILRFLDSFHVRKWTSELR